MGHAVNYTEVQVISHACVIPFKCKKGVKEWKKKKTQNECLEENRWMSVCVSDYIISYFLLSIMCTLQMCSCASSKLMSLLHIVMATSHQCCAAL